ncbi:diguanylate cyclase [Vibrio sp. S4M6]|nr:GGDEF domain-containing protein [Vibrio sinus]MCL9782788.1 diguanylate cyclase [Vibrio sinus]
MDIKSTLLDEKITQCGETLLRMNSLPPKLKRDLQDILNYAAKDGARNIEQSINLVTLYDKAVKILTTNPSLHTSPTHQSEHAKLHQILSGELQQVIDKLDFSGDIGDRLSDIRAKIELDSDSELVIQHTLETLQLVIDGTVAERKSSFQFLEQVNTALTTALSTSQQTSNQAEDELHQRQGINKELNGLVSSTQSEISNAKSLSQLQKNVEPLLAQISDLSKQLEEATTREAAMLEEMKLNNSQMGSLLESTQDYRKRYEDQQHKALLDPLTQLYNRNAFTDKLEVAFSRWIKAQDHLRIAILDPDNFGAINEKFGNSAGDKALRIVAKTIAKETDQQATLARFSGDQFILMFLHQDNEHNKKLIAKIQKKVSLLPFKFRDQNIRITLSALSDCFKDSDTPDDVLGRLELGIKQLKVGSGNQLIWL